MKAIHIKYGLLIFLVISFSKQQTLFAKNEKVRSENMKELITYFNVESMANNYLQDYMLSNKKAYYNFGRQFTYCDNNNKCLYFTIGLHPSREEAEFAAKSYLNEIELAYIEDSNQAERIGDRSWKSINNGIITGIIFINNNALIIIYSDSYDRLRLLSGKINNDIITKAKYIHHNDDILPPIIKLTANKKTIKLNEVAQITIDTGDSNNENLEYTFIPGLKKERKGRNNVYLFKPNTQNTKGHQSTIQRIRVYAINESNMVSHSYEIEFNCIK